MSDVDIKLENVEFVKDNQFGSDEYYLDVTYTATSKLRKMEYNFPRVKLPFSNYFSRDMNDYGEDTVNFGFGDLEMCIDREHPYKYTTKIVEEYVQEMTLEEIEKALGHKVKIVSSKEKEENKMCENEIIDKLKKKPICFEVGKCYKHSTGQKMRIIGEMDTYYYGHCLVGETDTGEYVPVGMAEEHAINWTECEDFARED